MLPYIIRRLLWLPVVLLVVSLITFALGYYGPGDPIQVRLGPRSNPDAVARMRHELGLDRPFLVQYADYVWKAAQGDLGESIKYQGEPVVSLIGRRIWVSAQLGLAAMVIGLVLGLPLGFFAALRQGSWVDRVIVSSSLLFAAVPTFVSGPLFLWLFASRLHLLPSAGWGGLFDSRVILPSLVLGLGLVAGFARQTRASIIDVLSHEYVRTAWSKGLAPQNVFGRHVARNALIPILTLFGLMLGGLVEGAFITETVFGIPGIGRLGVDSLFARDYPVIMALTLIVAVSYILANLLVDLLYAVLDPRIRYG